MPPSVSVVDDQPTVREVVARYLTPDGVTVHEAADAGAARAWPAGNRPGLAVLGEACERVAVAVR